MDFREMIRTLPADFVVIGIGNQLSGDDAFGSELIARLKSELGDRAIDGGLAPENWTGPIIRIAPDKLIIADAVAFGGEPGEIRILSPDDLAEGLPATHGPGLGAFLSYIEHALPELEISILAVQPEATGLGKPISDAVSAAIDRIVEFIEKNIESES